MYPPHLSPPFTETPKVRYDRETADAEDEAVEACDAGQTPNP